MTGYAYSSAPERPGVAQPIAWIALVGAAGLGLLSVNPIPSLAVLAALPLILVLLRRPAEPPVLLFAVAAQWAAASARVLQANLYGEPLLTALDGQPETEAIYLALLSVVVLACGMSVALRGLGRRGGAEADAAARACSVGRLFIAWVALLLFAIVLRESALRVRSIAQFVLPLFHLKWVLFYMLAYTVIVTRRGVGLLLAAVAVEVVVGFSGYFSGFKHVFFVLAIAYLATGPRIDTRRALVLGVIVALVVMLGVLWMSVRGEYREYLSQGQQGQVVLVPFESRMLKLEELLLSTDAQQFVEGADSLLSRVAYVEMFSHVLRRVPRSLPHTQGKLWGGAIAHVAMPRILFRDKPVLPSDSELTMRYTGLVLASAAQGTSVSMGYAAESYIDFGAVGMFVPVLLIGVLWGAMYRFMMTRHVSLLACQGVAVAVLIQAYQFEVHNKKLVGAMLMTFIVMSLTLLFAMPRLVRWLGSRP